MIERDISYQTITTMIFAALLISVFFFSDLVAVVIIVATVAGLALKWFSRQFDTRQEGWQKEREQWEKGKSWW